MSDADGKTENCTKCVNSMRNLFLAVAVAIPSIVIGLWICSKPDCNEVKDNEYLEYLCTAGLEQPLLFVNVMLLANMCGLLWLVSVFTGSCWLIGKCVQFPCIFRYSNYIEILFSIFVSKTCLYLDNFCRFLLDHYSCDGCCLL